MYYLYRHIRLDNSVPFYIGIGKKRPTIGTFKQEYYRAHEARQRTELWKRISRKGYKIEIIFESDDRDKICEKEREFIKIYGIKNDGGTLCNFTYGGDYTELTEEMRLAISKRMVGNKNGLNQEWNEDRRKATSDFFKGNTTWRGRKHTAESKLKISIALKNKKLSESHKLALRGTRSHQKPVFCENTKKSYNSICECVREMFGWNRAIKNSISRVCNNKRDNYKGYKFKFI